MISHEYQEKILNMLEERKQLRARVQKLEDCDKQRVDRIMELGNALRDLCAVCEGLAEQQEISDDWYKPALAHARRILGEEER